MKILLIEDELELSSSVSTYLKISGNVVEQVFDYQAAYEKVKIYRYDCALIDINLPDGSGLDLIKIIKQQNDKTGIIIISARNSITDRIKGLDLGADDYLVKPFDLAELNARVKSLFRRINFKGNNIIHFGEMQINPDDFELQINNSTIDLTKKEYNMLMFFVANANRVIAKETIAEHIWGDNVDMADSYDFVYAHIKNLRKKLQKHTNFNYIQTIYGIGYKLVSNNEFTN